MYLSLKHLQHDLVNYFLTVKNISESMDLKYQHMYVKMKLKSLFVLRKFINSHKIDMNLFSYK